MVKYKLKEGEYFNKQLGYVMVYDKSREECIPKHRYLAEKRLRRKLRHDEFVHHKDHNKRNNKLSNLKVINRTAHNKIRHKNETNFYGESNPSKHIDAKRRADMRRAWAKRKRMFGSTGAKNPARLRKLGRINGKKND